MMLTAVASRLGDRAGLVVFDRDVRSVVAPGHGRNQLGLVTEAMYQLDPVLAESDYLGAFATTLARFRRRAMLVVFTDLVEQAVGESLLPRCRSSAATTSWWSPRCRTRRRALGRHHPHRCVRRVPQGRRRAALDERRRTTARLRGLGATVVAPRQALALLADAYLKVKATGRL
jgi:uncharacterized protein (DUF58 family)